MRHPLPSVVNELLLNDLETVQTYAEYDRKLLRTPPGQQTVFDG